MGRKGFQKINRKHPLADNETPECVVVVSPFQKKEKGKKKKPRYGYRGRKDAISEKRMYALLRGGVSEDIVAKLKKPGKGKATENGDFVDGTKFFIGRLVSDSPVVDNILDTLNEDDSHTSSSGCHVEEVDGDFVYIIIGNYRFKINFKTNEVVEKIKLERKDENR